MRTSPYDQALTADEWAAASEAKRHRPLTDNPIGNPSQRRTDARLSKLVEPMTRKRSKFAGEPPGSPVEPRKPNLSTPRPQGNRTAKPGALNDPQP